MRAPRCLPTKELVLGRSLGDHAGSELVTTVTTVTSGSGYVCIVFRPQHGPGSGYVGICLPLWRGSLLYLVPKIPESRSGRYTVRPNSDRQTDSFKLGHEPTHPPTLFQAGSASASPTSQRHFRLGVTYAAHPLSPGRTKIISPPYLYLHGTHFASCYPVVMGFLKFSFLSISREVGKTCSHVEQVLTELARGGSGSKQPRFESACLACRDGLHAARSETVGVRPTRRSTPTSKTKTRKS